jgi:hypothetical protein
MDSKAMTLMNSKVKGGSMDSRAMVSMNYKAMRFNGLVSNAFNGL